MSLEHTHQRTNAGWRSAMDTLLDFIEGPAVERTFFSRTAMETMQKSVEMIRLDVERQLESAEQMREALRSVLDRFPPPDVIEDLKADAGYGYRPYTITMKDGEIVAARALIGKGKEQ